MGAFHFDMAAWRYDTHIETEWTMRRCLGIGSKRGRYGQTIRAAVRGLAQTSRPAAMPGSVLDASRYESLSASVAKPGKDRPMSSINKAGRPLSAFQSSVPKDAASGQILEVKMRARMSRRKIGSEYSSGQRQTKIAPQLCLGSNPGGASVKSCADADGQQVQTGSLERVSRLTEQGSPTH